MNNEQKELLANVQLGLDSQRLLGSNLGQYLQQRALQDVESALTELKSVDPEGAKRIRELQNQIEVAERVFIWLEDAIASAASAEHILNTEE